MRTCILCSTNIDIAVDGYYTGENGDDFLVYKETVHVECVKKLKIQACVKCQKLRKFDNIDLTVCPPCRGIQYVDSAAFPEYSPATHGPCVDLVDQNFEEVAKRMQNLWG